MAVLIEAISLIIRLGAIDTHFAGGRQAFERTIPNSTDCGDGTLIRVGFMVPEDVGAYVSVLEAAGLTFLRDGQTIDMAVVDQLSGPTAPTPWLEVGKITTNAMEVTACWAQGTTPGELALPREWTFEDSLSQTVGFSPEGADDDRLQFLRKDNGIDVHLNLLSGEEVYIGRPTITSDTGPSWLTRLAKTIHEARQIDEKLQALIAKGDATAAAPLFQRLEKLLEDSQSITAGSGVVGSIARYTRGLLLLILNRLNEAEIALRKAHQIQPGCIYTLHELVRCLREQNKNEEALYYAREASEVGPTSAAAWGNFAMCLINCHKRDEARKAIDFAINLDPTDPINRTIHDNFDKYFK